MSCGRLVRVSKAYWCPQDPENYLKESTAVYRALQQLQGLWWWLFFLTVGQWQKEPTWRNPQQKKKTHTTQNQPTNPQPLALLLGLILFNSNLRNSTHSASISHVTETSAVCKILLPIHGFQRKGQEINYGLNEAKMRPQSSLCDSVLSTVKNVTFSLWHNTTEKSLEKNPVVQATYNAWGSAEGSHPTIYQAIIHPSETGPRLLHKWNKIQLRSNRGRIWMQSGPIPNK